MSKKKKIEVITKDMMKKETREEQKEEFDNTINAIDIFSIYNGTHKSSFAPLVKIHYDRLMEAEEAKDSAKILTSQFELDRLLQLVLEEKKKNNQEKK